MDIPPLSALGQRIVIIGPSGAGKSTLAAALSRRLGVPAAYLDQMYHQPHTRWQPRPFAEFAAMHAAAIARDAWVSDGNYSRLLGERLKRATGVIWIDINRFAGMLGYISRSFGAQRHGRLPGAPDGLNLKMSLYILWEQPQKRRALAAMIAKQTIPVVRVRSMGGVRRLYRDWGLERG